jgi:hypothetical protein
MNENNPNGITLHTIEDDLETGKYLVRGNATGQKRKSFTEFDKAVAWAKAQELKPPKVSAAPPVTFPLSPEKWQGYVIEGISRDYGVTLTDVTGRFQEAWLVMSGQPVAK